MHYRAVLVVCGLAITALPRPANASVLITVDKSAQQLSVAVDGETRWRWRVSTGRPGYDTPSGTFRAFRMEADHFSKEFDDAPMPHSIFFTKIGHAIHGYLDTRHLGAPVSHGCVRLDPENATKLYTLIEQQGVLNTTVVVSGNASAAIARRGPAAEPPDASVESSYYPPSYRNDFYRNDSSYRGSSDERYAPLLVHPEYNDRQSGYPPTPPRNYPAFPRPWR